MDLVVRVSDTRQLLVNEPVARIVLGLRVTCVA